MKRTAIMTTIISALAAGSFGLTDPNFDLLGAGWTTYTAGSGAVTFPGTVAELTAFVFASAGIEQVESAFTTSGQEYQLAVQVNTNGNVLAGWRNSSDVDGPTTVYASGATGTRTILCDDPSYNKVFAEKTGSVGGIIDIESMITSNVTAPPSYGSAPGLISAVRASATSANLTWHGATDNITPVSEIVYRVYWSTGSASVISEGQKTSFTNTTTGLVTGLPSGQQVYFTVRAADRVGNTETNTVQQSIPASAGIDSWELYN